MALSSSIPKVLAGSALASFGFSFGKDTYKKTKEDLWFIALFIIAIYSLFLLYSANVWFFRNYKSYLKGFFIRIFSVAVFLFVYYFWIFLILGATTDTSKPSGWMWFLYTEHWPQSTWICIAIEHLIILCGIFFGIKQRAKRRVAWEAQEHNEVFLAEHGITELSGNKYRDSEGNAYRLEYIYSDMIELFAEGRRNKRAYIGIDETGKFTSWSGLTSK